MGVASAIYWLMEHSRDQVLSFLKLTNLTGSSCSIACGVCFLRDTVLLTVTLPSRCSGAILSSEGACEVLFSTAV